MEKIKPILSMVLRILFIVIVLSTSILSLLTGYIIFAPDTFPKPFRVAYVYPGKELGYDLPPGTVVVLYQTVTVVQNVDSGSSGTSTHSSGEYKPGEGIMYDTGSKIINLADEGVQRYIRIDTVLEFAPNDSKAYEEYLKTTSSSGSNKVILPEGGTTTTDYVTAFLDEVAKKKPIIDDTITRVVSSHKYADLYTADGKEKLKEEILTKINESLPDYKVIAVYFPEFVIE